MLSFSNPLSPESKNGSFRDPDAPPNLKISTKSKSVRVKTFINEKYKAGPIPKTDEKKSKKLKIINENELEIDSSSDSDEADIIDDIMKMSEASPSPRTNHY